jgi:hypothetical protein
VKASHTLDSIRVSVDGEHLVANAGLRIMRKATSNGTIVRPHSTAYDR